jgi:hypothetical protein
MWLHHKMHFEHPPGCGHTLYTLRARNHYKSLANFISCLLAEFHWYRSKLTLRSMWLHHRMHCVHPPGCGHTLHTVWVKNHDKSLVTFVSCLFAKFHWYRSKLTLWTMSLHHKMHFLHPPGCRHTLYRPLYTRNVSFSYPDIFITSHTKLYTKFFSLRPIFMVFL